MPLDSQTVTAPAPAGNTPAAPAPATGGSDSVSIPRSEYDTLSRYRSNFEGAKPYMERAQKFGITRPEQFDEWAPLHGAMTKRGLTPAQVAAMMGESGPEPQGAAQPGEPKSLTRDEMAKAMSDMKSEMLARGKHDALSTASAALRTKILTEALGEKPTEAEKKLFARAVQGWESEHVKLYPEGHPLRDAEVMPFGEDDYKSLAEELKGYRARNEAEEALNLGEATIAGRGKAPASVAGSTPASSKPDKGGSNARPGGKPSEAAVQAAYEKRVAARGRAPI